MLRAGKLRIPLYLGAESMDVGASFDFARLPIEVYSIVAPTLDFNGVSVTRSWDVRQGELSLDAYWGRTRTSIREYAREGVPGFLAAGVLFESIDVKAHGLALTYRDGGDQYRIGVHKASSERANSENWEDRPVLVSPVPGVSYYNVLPGPGMPERRAMEMFIANAAADVGLGGQVRLGAEYAVRQLKDMDRGDVLLFLRDKLLLQKNVLLLQKDKRLFRKDNCLFLMNFCLFLLDFKDYIMAIHPKKRMKVKSGHERLVLDVRPLLAARDIVNVFTFLKKNKGLPNAFAHDLTHGRAYRISNLYLELLCTKLNCTPNDLFIFKEDPKQSIGEHHALAALYQNTHNPTLLQKLKTHSAQELKAFYEQLDKV